MTTIGDADLADVSDPEDQDFEGSACSEAGSEDSWRSRRGGKKKRKINHQVDEAVVARAASIWQEMQNEDSTPGTSGGRRPIGRLTDPLWTQFQRRHPRPPKQRSRRAVLAELNKYCGIAVSEDASALQHVKATQLKQHVRAEVALARKAIATPVSTKECCSSESADRPLSGAAAGSGNEGVDSCRPLAAKQATISELVPEPVGQPLPIAPAAKSVLAAEIGASASDMATSAASNLDSAAVLTEPTAPGASPAEATDGIEVAGQSGQFADLQAMLSQVCGNTRRGTLVDKANVDWQALKQRLGVDGRDLARDRTHAGALERKAFLARSAQRQEAQSRVAARAAMRQKVSDAARLAL